MEITDAMQKLMETNGHGIKRESEPNHYMVFDDYIDFFVMSNETIDEGGILADDWEVI